MTSVDAARLLGVSASTIKRWVNEGRLQCVTTPGGHRRFARTDVERFREALGGEPDDVARQFLQLMLQDDSTYRLQGLMIEMRGRLGSWWQVADLLGEALRELGRQWAQGTCSIAQEHAATRRLQQALWACSGALPSPPLEPRCVLAAVEGEEHTLGLSLAEICLREAGWACLWLGSPTPTSVLVEAIQQFAPGMVAVSASASSNDADRLEGHFRAIEEASRRCGAMLVLGGDGAWPKSPARAHRVRSFAEYANL